MYYSTICFYFSYMHLSVWKMKQEKNDERLVTLNILMMKRQERLDRREPDDFYQYLPISEQIQQTTNWLYLSYFFLENRFWHFIQIKRQFAGNIKVYSLKKKSKIFLNVVCWNLYQACSALTDVLMYRLYICTCAFSKDLVFIYACYK